MDPVEKAIRNALEKGDAEDAAFRLRIYQAAQAALDKALSSGTVNGDQARERKARLRAVVANVEAEFAPAVAPEPVAAEAHRSGERVEPAMGGSPSPVDPSIAGFTRHPDFGDAPPSVPGEARSEPRTTGRNREPVPGIGRRLAAGVIRLFILATVVAAIGFGIWWAIDTGLFKSASERDTSVPNPPANTGEEDFTPKDAGAPQKPGDADAAREWITIFSPKDPTSVQAGAGASAEVIGGADSQALRIVSSTAESTVSFDVGEGVLERLSGQKAVFDIVARSLDGQPTQISVTCDFAAFGNCGRKRYEVGYETGEFLFEIQFPQSAPGGGGTIAVVSDVANGGKALDIVQIRAARAE